MPTLTPLAWALWISSGAAQLALVIFVGRSANIRGRWPSVAIFLAFRSLVTILLMGTRILLTPDAAAPIYFYVYWAAAVVSMVLRVWIIAELACALTVAAMSWRAAVRRVIPGFAALALVVSIAVLMNNQLPVMTEITGLVVTGSRIISSAWIATFLFVAFAGSLFGWEWDKEENGVALGLSIQATAECAVSCFISFIPLVSLLSNLQDLLYLVSLGIWGFSLMRRNEEHSSGTERLLELAAPYFSCGQKLRGE